MQSVSHAIAVHDVDHFVLVGGNYLSENIVDGIRHIYFCLDLKTSRVLIYSVIAMAICHEGIENVRIAEAYC